MEKEAVFCEYRIKCPKCNSNLMIVTEAISPVIVPCQGCEDAIVILNNTVFTVSYKYIRELSDKYRVRMCGRVLGSQISNKAMKILTDNKINELHLLLEQPMDVNDFIKKIK
jgi:hypothetical protein